MSELTETSSEAGRGIVGNVGPDLRIEPQFGPSGNALRQYSADGRFLLAGGKLYDSATLATIRRNAGQQFVFDDTAVRNGLIARDIETWQIVADCSELFNGDAYTAQFTMSADGEHAAWFGSRDWTGNGYAKDDYLTILDTGSLASLVDIPLDTVRPIAPRLEFSPDGETLWVWYSIDYDQAKLSVFILATGERIDCITRKGEKVHFIAETANPAGLVISHCSLPSKQKDYTELRQNYLAVQDLRSGNPVATLCRPADDYGGAHMVAWGEGACRFSSDGSLFALLLVRDEDGLYQYHCEAVIFETRVWKEVKRITLPSNDPWSDKLMVAISPDNRRLQIGEDEYDLITGRLVRSFKNIVDQSLLARSRVANSTSLTRVHQSGAVAIWDVIEGRQTASSQILGDFLALSADGILVASLCKDHFKDLAEDRYKKWPKFEDARAEFEWLSERHGDAIVVQETASGQVVAALPTSVSRFDAVAFSPDNTSLVAGYSDAAHNYDTRQVAWDLEKRSLRWFTAPGYTSGQDFVFSADCKLFVRQQCTMSSVRVFDAETGEMLWDFPLENPTSSTNVASICFDPLRPVLIVCPPYSPVILFNLVTGEQSQLSIRTDTLVFSANGSHVAWADGIRKWGADTDIVRASAAGQMRGASGVFRGDAFYGCFWPEPRGFTMILYYRLSDGELHGGWQAGFEIDEVRIVDASQPGRYATLVALSELQTRTWGDGIGPDGLLMEFLPAGALLTDGAKLERWTPEAVPHLRAYQGTREISLGAFLQARQADSGAH